MIVCQGRMTLTYTQTYDKTVIPRLVSTMNEFLDLNPALEILISATIRNEATFETFLNACSGYIPRHYCELSLTLWGN